MKQKIHMVAVSLFSLSLPHKLKNYFMKIFRTLLMTVLPVVFLLCNIGNVSAQSTEFKVKAEFHCNGGKTLIQNEVMKLEGVSTVVADLDTKIVTINYDAAKQTQATLVAAIEKTGHKTELTKEGTEIKSNCATHGVGDKKCDTEPKQ
jgi:copper chaperone CopZ